MPEVTSPVRFSTVRTVVSPSDIGPLFADLERAEADHAPINEQLLRAARIGAMYIHHALAGGDLLECVIPGDRAVAKIEALIATAEQAQRSQLCPK